MEILTAQPPVVRPDCRLPRYENWQEALRDSVRDPVELCQLLDLPDKFSLQAEEACGDFPLFAPRGYVARMKPGCVDDPLLRQVLPVAAETAELPGFSHDPVGDHTATLQPGLIQKYHGRALLITTGVCAVHCRYCFRRHFPYETAPKSPAAWDSAIDAIESDRSIHEVILSGGDPLMLVDESLAELANSLAGIAHVTRLRIHTRLPVVLPERVCEEMLAWLTSTRLTPIVVIHANHANELSHNVPAALDEMAGAGIPLLNQAVLLSGVNDTVKAQLELCERLVDLRVMPYYLHQLDRVDGAAHFEVPIELGQNIIQALKTKLPGYAVPRYVQEIAGEVHKIDC